MQKYSVLMSVYYKENPIFLQESIDSMLNQTIPPDEIVIVKDGKLTIELDNVLDKYIMDDRFKIIALDKNIGLGLALEIGLNKCKNNIVARMDTDDISVPNRCEKQLLELQRNPNLSLIGSSVIEFNNSIKDIVAIKEAKESNNEIKKQMKFRNPINHPTVMFKKDSVINAGGYQDFKLNEDYYLWVRMMENNCEFQNILEPLVYMRVNNETYIRRGGWNYFLVQKKLLDYMLKNKIINIFEYVYNISVRFVVRVIFPNNARKWFYQKILRKTL